MQHYGWHPNNFLQKNYEHLGKKKNNKWGILDVIRPKQ